MSCSMQPEHGLSIWLETARWNCLLDAGPSPRFIGHAAQMGIDLQQAGYVFLSHGHNDHTGGLRSLLELNPDTRVLVAENAMKQEFYSERTSLHDLTNRDDFSAFAHRFVHSFAPLEAQDIFIYQAATTHFPLPKANEKLKVRKDETLIADDFSHERVFATLQDNRLLVYSGCSHRGLLNVLHTTQQRFGRNPDILIGGFHFPDGAYETEEELRTIARQLKTLFPETILYTGHCTGEKALTLLQQEAGNQIRMFYTGLQIHC